MKASADEVPVLVIYAVQYKTGGGTNRNEDAVC